MSFRRASNGGLLLLTRSIKSSAKWETLIDYQPFRPSKPTRGLDTERELHADVDISSHLDNLGKVHRLLRCFLEVGDGEDLES